MLRKDAIFLSPHKFVGGPSTPGVLLVKKALLTSSRVNERGEMPPPEQPAGGTVFFVDPKRHRYVRLEACEGCPVRSSSALCPVHSFGRANPSPRSLRFDRYLANLEEREEGGTPDIVGAVRCGLVFQVRT